MKIAIMQPYLFPYLGYFQLMNAVDKYVIYDDVQYISRGWINRNNLLVNEKQHLFTVSVEKDEQYKSINERYYCSKTFDKEIQKFYSSLTMWYKKAIYFDEVFELVHKIFQYDELNVAEFNSNLLKVICHYMGISNELIKSSEIVKNNDSRGEDKILEINKMLKSSEYINAIGGAELYDRDTFEKNNIKLNFIKTLEVQYKQFNNVFVPNLSIIDVLMFNSKEEIKQLLNKYELV
ncbi:WbqC family protein [Clostridium sp.]|uniref:WbqC family protein n=1 Tax=Clostridium sp. TaxID=1506 RepID=UPI003F4B2A2B